MSRMALILGTCGDVCCCFTCQNQREFIQSRYLVLTFPHRDITFQANEYHSDTFLLTVVFEFIAQFIGAIAGTYLLYAVTPFPVNVAPSLVQPLPPLHIEFLICSHPEHPLCRGFSLNFS